MQPKLVLFTVVGVSFSEPRFAFDVVVPRDDSTLFLGHLGVLPAVTGAENHGESYDRVGDSRTVWLSDGGTFREEIVRYVRPSAQDATGYFDYDVTRFTGILSRIVSDATARWTYAPGTPGRTRITWTYGYRPLPGRTFLVHRVIGPLWLRYMRRSMGNALAAIAAERRAAGRAASAPADDQPERPDGRDGGASA
jgi:hypothetical protein